MSVLELLQRLVGFFQREHLDFRMDGDFCGNFQEFLRIVTGAGGDAAHGSLSVEKRGIIQLRDGVEINRGNSQSATFAQVPQGGRNEPSRGSKENPPAQLSRRALFR